MNLIVVYLVCYTCSCGHMQTHSRHFQTALFLFFVHLFVGGSCLRNESQVLGGEARPGSAPFWGYDSNIHNSRTAQQCCWQRYFFNLVQVKYWHLALKCSINWNMNAETEHTQIKNRRTHSKQQDEIIYQKLCTHQTLITLLNTRDAYFGMLNLNDTMTIFIQIRYSHVWMASVIDQRICNAV